MRSERELRELLGRLESFAARQAEPETYGEARDLALHCVVAIAHVELLKWVLEEPDAATPIGAPEET